MAIKSLPRGHEGSVFCLGLTLFQHVQRRHASGCSGDWAWLSVANWSDALSMTVAVNRQRQAFAVFEAYVTLAVACS